MEYKHDTIINQIIESSVAMSSISNNDLESGQSREDRKKDVLEAENKNKISYFSYKTF